MIFNIFSILSTTLYIYGIICFIRILLSWFPGAMYSPFGRFLASITDPYLNFFRRFNILRFGPLDFSPALALGVLGLATFILTGLSYPQAITIGTVLAEIFYAIWNICSAILVILIIIFGIRTIVLLFTRPFKAENPFWEGFDRIFVRFIYKISNIFTLNKMVRYKTALIISTFFLLGIYILFSKIVVPILYSLLRSIPI